MISSPFPKLVPLTRRLRAVQERERSCRVVLQYGCEVQLIENERNRVNWYLRVKGDGLLRGAKCDFDPRSHLIERIAIRSSPSPAHWLHAEDIVLCSSNSDEFGYCLSFEPKQRSSPRGDSSMCCDFTIHWNSELGLSPIEIKAVAPSSMLPHFRRWLVVQFPVRQGRTTQWKAVPPIVYGDGVKLFSSGWVCYLSGKEARVYVGPRVYGRAALGTKVCSSLSSQSNVPLPPPLVES